MKHDRIDTSNGTAPSGGGAHLGMEYMTSSMSAQAAAAVASEIATGIEQMTYRDCSRITPDDVQRTEGILPDAFASPGDSSSSSSPLGKDPPFPLKLHRILSDEECQSAIVWLEHGRAWRIVDPKELERTVLSRHFKHTQFTSFMRQVTGWGFRRVTSGRDEGAYFNDCFLRGLPHICLKMRRVTGKRSKFGRMSVNPDFYALSERHPVPDEDGNMPETSSSSNSKQQPETAATAPTSSAQPEQSSGSSSVPLQGATNGAAPALPQHLVAAANLLQNPTAINPNQAQDLSQLFQNVRALSPGAGSPLPVGLNNVHGHVAVAARLQLLQQLQQQQAQQALSQGINMHLTALNLQRLQQCILQPNASSINSGGNNIPVVGSAPDPPQRQRQMQPLDLLSMASQMASMKNKSTGECPTGSTTIADDNVSSSASAPKTARQEEETKAPSGRGVEETPESQDADKDASSSSSPPRRAFMSPPKFGDTSSRSSSSAGLNESGSESSTDNPAQNAEEQEQDDNSGTLTSRRGREDNETNSSLFSSDRSRKSNNGDGSINSSSSVSMSESGSDSGAQPAESSNDGDSTDSKGERSEEGEGTSLRRHRSSRLKTSDRAASSVAMSPSESRSDTSSRVQQPVEETSSTPRKVEPTKDQVSDQSTATSVANSASSNASSNASSSASSLRKLWDLVSSADESNASASHLMKASKSLVGALIGSDVPSDAPEDSGLESDAVSAPSSTQSSNPPSSHSSKQRVEFAIPDGESDKPSLDVAAKAMTLGILWGIGRAGAGATAPPGTAVTNSVTNSGASRNDSLSNADDEFDVKSILSNSSLHSSIAAALTRQKMEMQGAVTGSDAGNDEQQSTSLSGSSDEGEKRAQKHESKHPLHKAAGLGGKAKLDETSKSAFGPPTEVTWGHKRKASSAASNLHEDDEPGAKRRARDMSPTSSESRAQLSPNELEGEAKTVSTSDSSSTRGKPSLIRSLSSLTTPIDDCSAVSTSKLTKSRLAEKNRLGASTRMAHSVASSQPSDISGEDFETGSSQSGQSGSSNNDISSDVFPGSTSHVPGSSAESTESMSGDERAETGDSASATASPDKERQSTGPAKKRKICSADQ